VGDAEEEVRAVRLSCDCPLCGLPLIRKRRHSDGEGFLSCHGYPRCKFAEPVDAELEIIHQQFNVAESDASYLRDLLRATKNQLLGLREPITPRQLEEIARWM
jgi:ssDNA-binding Zn-finger/Zn-ribbon topoisomerase 1